MAFKGKKRGPAIRRYVRKGSSIRPKYGCRRIERKVNCTSPEREDAAAALMSMRLSHNLPPLESTQGHAVLTPSKAKAEVRDELPPVPLLFTPRREEAASALLRLSHLDPSGNADHTKIDIRASSPGWQVLPIVSNVNQGIGRGKGFASDGAMISAKDTASLAPTPRKWTAAETLLRLSDQAVPSGLLHPTNEQPTATSPGWKTFSTSNVTKLSVRRELDFAAACEKMPDNSDGIAPLPLVNSDEVEDHIENTDCYSSPPHRVQMKSTMNILKLANNSVMENPKQFTMDVVTAVSKSTQTKRTSKDRSCQTMPMQVPTRRVLMSYEFCMSLDEQQFKRLTGMHQSHFLVLLQFLGPAAECLKYRFDTSTPSKRCSTIATETRLLITLLRLRRGWDVLDIALFFGVSSYTVSKTVFTWVQFMYLHFKRMQGAMFVSRHEQPKRERPKVFKRFKNFRVCIDTTEVRIQSPDNFEQQGNTYSDYKSGNVWLYLIGISCWGGCSFISPGFEGSMSDKAIYKESGIRNFLEEGDVVLADRGFTIDEECDEDGVVCVHPPFMKGRRSFLPEEEQLTREVATARIFVEHMMRRIKTFVILKKISNSMLHYLDQIVYVCGCLVNFGPPIVRKK